MCSWVISTKDSNYLWLIGETGLYSSSSEENWHITVKKKAVQEPLPLPPCDRSRKVRLVRHLVCSKRKRERNSHCTTSALDKAQPYNAVTPTQNVGAYACRLRVVLINLSRIEVRVQQQNALYFQRCFIAFPYGCCKYRIFSGIIIRSDLFSGMSINVKLILIFNV